MLWKRLKHSPFLKSHHLLDSTLILPRLICMQEWYNSEWNKSLPQGFQFYDTFLSIPIYYYKLFPVHHDSQTQQDVSSFVFRFDICKFCALTVIIMDSGKFNFDMNVYSLLLLVKLWSLPQEVLPLICPPLKIQINLHKNCSVLLNWFWYYIW